MFYQYQLSRANLITLQSNNPNGRSSSSSGNSRSNSGVLVNEDSNVIDTNEVLNNVNKIKTIDAILNQDDNILINHINNNNDKLSTSTSTTTKKLTTHFGDKKLSPKFTKVISTQSDEISTNVNNLNELLFRYSFVVFFCSF